MSRAFFTPKEIMAVSQGELPLAKSSFDRFVKKSAWRADQSKARKQAGREGGGGWEYHISLLPSTIQSRLLVIHGSPSNQNTDHEGDERNAVWAAYNGLTAKNKKICAFRLECLMAVESKQKGGMNANAAMRIVAKEQDIAVSTLATWKATVRSKPRADWLAHLAPQFKGATYRADCHPEAYQALKSDFLRPEGPTFSACLRRVRKAAKKYGWEPIPSERALRRHLDADVPKEVQILARKGKNALKAVFPEQRRKRDMLHAMEAVNMDGHKFDVFIKLPDQEKPTRMFLIALQDLYSNKFVAWRLSDSENKETVRLVIGDMVERFGIPDRITLDNGRAFTSKDITGGAKTRFRFKIRDEDPQGLLVSLGVDIQWTTPYSGQSKPIERAFRDLCDTVAKHPVCSGAYVGNKPDAKPENYGSKAVELDVFKRLVDQEIHEHNSRDGRTNPIAKGRSFDQVFEESLAQPETIVRWPTTAQKALWLMAADRVRAKKSNGEINLFGNRYWTPALTAYAGQNITARFDPENLFAGIHVYDFKDRLIAEAPCVEDSGFYSVSAARIQSKTRNAYLKAAKDMKDLHAKLTPTELGDLYQEVEPIAPESKAPIRTKVTRLATGSNLAHKISDETDEEQSRDQTENLFQRGMMKIIQGGLEDP